MEKNPSAAEMGRVVKSGLSSSYITMKSPYLRGSKGQRKWQWELGVVSGECTLLHCGQPKPFVPRNGRMRGRGMLYEV